MGLPARPAPARPRPGFAARLRAATRTDHDAGEQSAYMSALAGGRLGRDEYAVLVTQLYLLYDVLEQAADRMRSDEVASAFDLPGFRRRDALRADLAFFHGPRWAEQVRPTAATRRYLDRLREVCFDWPGGFVAHHYTRYLGDLSGGQVIAARLVRAYGLTDGHGVRFYRFEGRPKALKDRYRALLDTAPWDEAEQARIIDEVKVAYRLNTELNAELDAALGSAPRMGPAA
ncbi:biliverdin-producing heme oxygenase [Actinomadura craniellae]|uniref:biliverdin-producing heme oxygenase n=1 Tax=Actinomadura craniellae TaxID=2231787 RepID=UPI001F433334|nr:biliverdin-producing heme oxygenase [Actinomadura craniellae]